MSRKICKAPGCNNFVFSNEYCKFHQYKNPKYSNKIKRRTKKRASQEKEYNDSRKEFIEYKKKKGEYKCIFCGKGFKRTPDVHHLDGREEGKLLDWNMNELAHSECHMDYHNKSISKLPWFDEYLERIKHINYNLYLREYYKKFK